MNCTGTNLSWQNPHYNFDNVGVALLTLTTVGIGPSPLPIMWEAIDSTEPGLAPERNHSAALGLYFIAFVILGSLTALNFFIAALVDTWNNEDGALLTDNQKAFTKSLQVLCSAPQEAKERGWDGWSQGFSWIYSCGRNEFRATDQSASMVLAACNLHQPQCGACRLLTPPHPPHPSPT